MATKEEMVKAIQDLPDDAALEDAIERLFFIRKVERGIAQADAGQTVSHEEARRRMAKWLNPPGSAGALARPGPQARPPEAL